MPNITLKNSDWFTESDLPYSESVIKISTKIDACLFDEKSKFGHIQVFDTPFYGRMLTLDGILQVAEKDEFIYHEMMVTLPSVIHGNVKSVLVIGGGDGGAIKQALRIKSVKRVVLVEIDRKVIDICQKFIPKIANGAFDDPRVELIIEDGATFVKNCDEQFDIIALDLTDPVPEGPAADLYEEPFYNNVKSLLSKRGVMSTHCSSLVIQPEEAKVMIPRLKKIFESVTLHTAVVPSYQLTSFGFLMARKVSEDTDQDVLNKGFANLSGPNQYLTKDLYSASKTLPPYLVQSIS